MTLRHVALISFRPCTPPELQEKIFNTYQTVAEDCGGVSAGILEFQVGKNLDLRKGVHLVEFAEFRDNEALQAFRVHPKHKALTDILREVADWQVGDINR
jgi:hypothetical protein